MKRGNSKNTNCETNIMVQKTPKMATAINDVYDFSDPKTNGWICNINHGCNTSTNITMITRKPTPANKENTHNNKNFPLSQKKLNIHSTKSTKKPKTTSRIHTKDIQKFIHMFINDSRTENTMQKHVSNWDNTSPTTWTKNDPSSLTHPSITRSTTQTRGSTKTFRNIPNSAHENNETNFHNIQPYSCMSAVHRSMVMMHDK